MQGTSGRRCLLYDLWQRTRILRRRRTLCVATKQPISRVTPGVGVDVGVDVDAPDCEHPVRGMHCTHTQQRRRALAITS
jgi:hypothetical protein